MVSQIIVVALITNDAGQLFIQQRQTGQTFADYWEYPGGKVEPHETPQQALWRECAEEVALQPHQARGVTLLGRVYHTLNARKHLDFFVYHIRTEQPLRPQEGQNSQWVEAKDIAQHQRMYPMPPANGHFMTLWQTPDIWWITPDVIHPDRLSHPWQHYPQASLAKGVILRQTQWQAHDWVQRGLTTLQTLAPHFDRIHVNTTWENWQQLWQALPEADKTKRQWGWHLNRHELARWTLSSSSPGAAPFFRSASVHNIVEAEQATGLGVDFAVVSPVATTSSHPGQPPLSQTKVQAIYRHSQVPLMALGGQNARTFQVCNHIHHGVFMGYAGIGLG